METLKKIKKINHELHENDELHENENIKQNKSPKHPSGSREGPSGRRAEETETLKKDKEKTTENAIKTRVLAYRQEHTVKKIKRLFNRVARRAQCLRLLAKPCLI